MGMGTSESKVCTSAKVFRRAPLVVFIASDKPCQIRGSARFPLLPISDKRGRLHQTDTAYPSLFGGTNLGEDSTTEKKKNLGLVSGLDPAWEPEK